MGKRFCFLTISLLLFFTACGGENSIPQVTAPSAETTQASTPAATAEQSLPTGEALWTEDVHTGLREDGTFNDGTLFIGDSLTYGLVVEYLQRYELIGDAKYFAVVGAPLSRFFSYERLGQSGDGIYSPEFYNLTYSEAATQMGENATAIYLMLGTNSGTAATTDKYIEVVDYLLENCPNATVHLQLIPICTSQSVDYEAVNDNIRAAYQHYQEAGNQKVMLIDTFTAIGLAQGYDGIHLNAEGKDAWYTAIVAHAINYQIPE